MKRESVVTGVFQARLKCKDMLCFGQCLSGEVSFEWVEELSGRCSCPQLSSVFLASRFFLVPLLFQVYRLFSKVSFTVTSIQHVYLKQVLNSLPILVSSTNSQHRLEMLGSSYLLCTMRACVGLCVCMCACVCLTLPFFLLFTDCVRAHSSDFLCIRMRVHACVHACVRACVCVCVCVCLHVCVSIRATGHLFLLSPIPTRLEKKPSTNRVSLTDFPLHVNIVTHFAFLPSGANRHEGSGERGRGGGKGGQRRTMCMQLAAMYLLDPSSTANSLHMKAR